ncbi:hypothetical protein BJV78DRAFT_253446 [Lactifluus subvellereus]|nr:hypothetical protein BJV78DRAFT_253446 [Lactifluus subvellereus]
MSLSVSSFPEPSKLAISPTSPKSRRRFFGTLFSKGSAPFLKGVRQLGKLYVKGSVIHPVDGAAASPSRDHSSTSRSSVLGPNIVIDIIAVPDSGDCLATPTSHDVPAPHPTAKVASLPLISPTPLPTLAAAEHGPATLARVLTKAPHLLRPPSPLGDRAHSSPKNTLSPAKELDLTVPNANVAQRDPQSRTLFNLKSSSTVSLVGSSGQGRVPEALPPVRARCKSDTATSRTASASPGDSWKKKGKGKGASPRVSPGVNPAASDGVQARSHSEVLPQRTSGESFSSQQRWPRQNETRASTHRRTTSSDGSSTSSTLVGQSKESPLLAPRLLSVHISHMRSGSRPTPALSSSHRFPKTVPPIRAARAAPVPKSAPPLPDYPTVTVSDEDGKAPASSSSSPMRPAQLPPPPPPPHAPVTSDSGLAVDSAGPGARSAPPSFLVTGPPDLPDPDPDERQPPQPELDRGQSRLACVDGGKPEVAGSWVQHRG